MSLQLTRRGLAGSLAASPLLFSASARAQAAPAADDARSLIDLIFQNYAYAERLAGFSEQRLRLLRERDAPRVADRGELVSFGERALAALFDHHAILGASRATSYGLVPSYADLWIVEGARRRLVVEDVRAGSPAFAAGVRPGDVLTGAEGVAIDAAIARFIGAPVSGLSGEQRAFCARVIAAGRRDRARLLAFARNGARRRYEIANLYQQPLARAAGGLSARSDDSGIAHVRFNDSLGDGAVIAAFDAAMADLRSARGIVIDLRDTASGGNTSVARGVMGWFVDAPRPYQRHELPAEQRATGARRSWIEEVSPRGEKFAGKVSVLVGRWTGSMGEGMALGFDALGVPVVGSAMAGLLGAIYDYPLPNTGLILKLPAERMAHVDGRPREVYRPPTFVTPADAPDANGEDRALTVARRLVSA